MKFTCFIFRMTYFVNELSFIWDRVDVKVEFFLGSKKFGFVNYFIGDSITTVLGFDINIK